jgi:hypothetical protein
MFDNELLSYGEEEFEGNLTISGYYDEKYFSMSIEDNDFILSYDDTECTDEELEEIFKYYVNHKN